VLNYNIIHILLNFLKMIHERSKHLRMLTNCMWRYI